MGTPVRSISPLAVISMVFGILGWTLLPLLGSVVAIVMGHIARGEIRRAPERLQGDGFAIAGLILGYLAIAFAIIAVVIFVLFFGGLVWLGHHS